MDGTTGHKINKEIEDVNNTVNQLDLPDIYRTLHSSTEYTFFSSAHGTFSRINHILAIKQILINIKG